MRLSGAVIRVLAQDDHFDMVEGRGVESIEDKAAGGVDGFTGQLFSFQERGDLEEIGLGELLFEHSLPALFDFYVHAGDLCKLIKVSGKGQMGY